MSLVVIGAKALGPIDVGFLGAVGIVLESYCIAHLVERYLGLLCHASLQKSGFARAAE